MNITTFQKHALKVTKSKQTKSRPTLQGIHYLNDGAVCTDSHRLYKINTPVPGLAGQTINPDTGETIDGNYPDTSRLFPDRFEKHDTWDLKPAIAFLKAVKSLKIGHVVYGQGVLYADSLDMNTSLQHTLDPSSDVERSAISTVYLLEALELMATAGPTAEFLWNNRYAPVVLRDHAYSPILETLILPIRLNK